MKVEITIMSQSIRVILAPLFNSTSHSSPLVVQLNRPLSRDVTHDELRIWPPCWRENKKEQKKFLKKYVNNIEYNG